MSWLTIEKILYAQLDGLGLGYPIVIENDTQDTSKLSLPYIEVYNLPAQTDTIDKNISERYNGIYQISIFTDLGKGKNQALTIADQVISGFMVNDLPVLNGCTVSIDNRSIDTARRDGKSYRVDISIEYFSLNSL